MTESLVQIDPISARYIATCYPGSRHKELPKWREKFTGFGRGEENVKVDLREIERAFPTLFFYYKIGLIPLIGGQRYFEGFDFNEVHGKANASLREILEPLRGMAGKSGGLVNIHNMDRYRFARGRKDKIPLPHKVVLRHSIGCSVSIATKVDGGYDIFSFGEPYFVPEIDRKLFGLPDSLFYYVHGRNRQERPIAIRPAIGDEREQMRLHYASYSRKSSRNPFLGYSNP
jgi:hypothetical protein